jgi:hypothetical protein
VAQGFDNIGAALNISPVLMERYLDAAEAVLAAAVAPPPKPVDRKMERYNLYDSLPSWFSPGTYPQDEGVVLFRCEGSASQLGKYRAPGPGRYRVRIAASAFQSEQPLAMSVLFGNFNTAAGSARHMGYFNAPPGAPAVVEVTGRFEKFDTVKVHPVSLPFVYLKRETMPDYPGPGLHIHWIEIEGPLPETWPTESYRRIYGDVDPAHGALGEAENILRGFLPKAFRRPVQPDEVKPYVALVAKALEDGQPFEIALRAGFKGVLASPKFLYFREKRGPLDDYALASRLSYFLWSTMPDDELLALAARNTLHEPATLRAQVERLLQHEKGRAFTENFTGQWLNLRNIALNTPDKALYPEFDELLQWSMVRETQLFFDELLKRDLPVRNVIDSDFAMINGRLARHYGIEGVHGVDFQRVALKPENHRGGLLTQASVLKVTANGTTTSPVLRGVWLLDRIIGQPAPPPPASVPAIEPDIRGATTIREQLAKHRETENCAGCHRRIDPPGFALESYDVIGGWREKYRTVGTKNKVQNRVGPLAKYLAAVQYGEGLPVESGDQMADGGRFGDVAEFKKLLLEHEEQVARCMTEKLMIYATGHRVEFGDHEIVDAILQATKNSGHGLRSLLHAVVQSETFRTK